MPPQCRGLGVGGRTGGGRRGRPGCRGPSVWGRGAGSPGPGPSPLPRSPSSPGTPVRGGGGGWGRAAVLVRDDPPSRFTRLFSFPGLISGGWGLGRAWRPAISVLRGPCWAEAEVERGGQTRWCKPLCGCQGSSASVSRNMPPILLVPSLEGCGVSCSAMNKGGEQGKEVFHQLRKGNGTQSKGKERR